MKLLATLLILFAQSAFCADPSSCDYHLEKSKSVPVKMAEEIARNFPRDRVAPVLAISASKLSLSDFNELQKTFRERYVQLELVNLIDNHDKTEIEFQIYGTGENIASGLTQLQVLINKKHFGESVLVEDRWSRPVEYGNLSAELLQTPLDTIDFSVRTLNALSSAGIHRIGDLIQIESVADLARIPRLGAKSRAEITDFLSKQKLQLNTKLSNWELPDET